jgi:hypothetical protein
MVDGNARASGFQRVSAGFPMDSPMDFGRSRWTLALRMSAGVDRAIE